MSGTASTNDVTFVEDRAALATAVEAIRRAPIVGFDTEFVGEATYEPQLCLLQIATPDAIFIIDPLANLDLREFWQAITEPDRQVVALAAREEILYFLRYAGRTPGVIFDPQIAAGLLGFSYPLSHTRLVDQVLGRRVGGGETLTDWRKRPLTQSQLEYAADDVRHLIEMRETLVGSANTLHRLPWVEAECEALVERVIESTTRERWQRTPGASRLNGRELAVLRAIWTWRDDTARAADITPRRIMGDDLLIEVAKRKPRDQADLFSLRGMNRPNLRQAGPKIMAAVQAGMAVPDNELPVMTRRDDPPQLGILTQIAAALVGGVAQEQQVEPSLLATTGDLQEFIRRHLGIATDEPKILSGWRGELLAGPLTELLEGKRTVRVADAHSANPLRIEPLS